MKEDKAYIIRKIFIVITLILLTTTLGLILISFQMKTIKFNYYGNVKEVKTLSSTVQSFLLQNNVNISENETIYPSLNSQLTNGEQIVIEGKKELSKIDTQEYLKGYKPTVLKVVETAETIPYSNEQKENSSVNQGVTNVLQQGKEGQKINRSIVKYDGDSQVEKTDLQSEVAVAPQNQVVEVGTKINQIASRSSTVNLPSTIEVDSGFKQYNISLPLDEQKYAYNITKQYGIQYELLLALMYKESGYNASAANASGATGLCQIIFNYNKTSLNKIGVNSSDDLLNPYTNIMSGAYILSNDFTSARTISSDNSTIEAYALSSYNMGVAACLSRGIANTSYSNSIIYYRNRLLSTGGI